MGTPCVNCQNMTTNVFHAMQSLAAPLSGPNINSVTEEGRAMRPTGWLRVPVH